PAPETKPAAPPPAPIDEADIKTYEALVRAIKEQGLEDRVIISGPPKDGSVNLEFVPAKGGRAKAAAPLRSRISAPITDDER
ncbi:MAG: hypothetical protein WCK65_07775, partial [Rhodospirillaceae bacterium]